MKTLHELSQGSELWHSFRADHFGASEAAAMLGVSKYQTRAELFRLKATGIPPEVSPHLQAIFDRGHQAEIGGRIMAQAIIGQELYPVTVSEGYLSASCDGLTMIEDVAFEHKLYNVELADSVRAGVLPAAHQPQCQQVMMLTGADKLLFMTSDGTSDNCAWMWVEPEDAIRKTLSQGWTQFSIDLAAYVHVEQVAAPVAAPIKSLPAIIITATGSLTVETNFAKWEAELRAFINLIPEKPSTDQEFADCKAALAAFKAAEAALDAEEARVLTMVPSVDDMRRHKKLLRDLSSTTRLALEKTVTARDVTVKAEIMQVGRDNYSEHITILNRRIGGLYMPFNMPNFAEAIKNKRSYASMAESVNTMLLNAKFAASDVADTVDVNISSIPEVWNFLFVDLERICTKSREDFANLVESRISAQIEMQAAKDKATKDAEDARVADAVETERKAGEAREGQAIKAEADKISDDSRARFLAASTPEKSSALAASDMGLSMDGMAGKSVRADYCVNVVRIEDFLRLQPGHSADKRVLREVIEKWENYRIRLDGKVVTGA